MDNFDNFKYDAEGTLRRLYDQDSLLDILIEFEGSLDSMDLYAFKNWYDGEVVKGPNLERYWVTVTLKYPYKKMPDPQGGMRLVKHGAKIFYKKEIEEVPVSMEKFRDNPQDAYVDNPETGKRERKKEKHLVWLVVIKIPRRFIEDMEKGQMYLDDEEDTFVDLSAASDAENEGLDDETIIDGGVDEQGADDDLFK